MCLHYRFLVMDSRCFYRDIFTAFQRSSVDSMYDSWKSVQRIRHADYSTPVWSIILPIFIIFYSASQGITTRRWVLIWLLFCFFFSHIEKAVWSLWQSYSFRNCAANSIKPLQNPGAQCLVNKKWKYLFPVSQYEVDDDDGDTAFLLMYQAVTWGC